MFPVRLSAAGELRERIARMRREADDLEALLKIVELNSDRLIGPADEALWALLIRARQS